MAISKTLTLTLVFNLLLFTTCHGARMLLQTETSTEFIRTSCNATSYPALCFSSLSAYASMIKTSPLNLASAALSVSLAGAQSTTAAMNQMSMSSAPSMKQYDREALHDCMDTLSDAVDELTRSTKTMSNLGGKETGYQINSVQTWVSAALTDDDTCMDGFRSSGEDVKNEVRSHVLNVVQLTSNALDLINGFSKTIIHSLP